MSIRALRIDGVRNLRDLAIEASPGLNVFVGENGAGKTSILESIQCLATGRSFRGGPPLAWLNRELGRAELFARVDDHRLGLRQTRDGWNARIDGSDARSRADLSRHLPYFVFHPESHALVEGPPESRRRLVDHGVFHVEPSFLDAWRRYRRALSQRNAALKQRVTAGELRTWEEAMLEPAKALTGIRQQYVARLADASNEIIETIGARVPRLELSWYRGWGGELDFEQALDQARETDRERGYTSVGPQRGDLRIRDHDVGIAGRVSRGQQKIVAACLLLGQARLFEAVRERSPIFAIDDVGSELDKDHESRLGQWLGGQGWQVWLTGLESPGWVEESVECAMFHVEHGALSRVI